jgi:hypothetical protein
MRREMRCSHGRCVSAFRNAASVSLVGYALSGMRTGSGLVRCAWPSKPKLRSVPSGTRCRGTRGSASRCTRGRNREQLRARRLESTLRRGRHRSGLRYLRRASRMASQPLLIFSVLLESLLQRPATTLTHVNRRNSICGKSHAAPPLIAEVRNCRRSIGVGQVAKAQRHRARLRHAQ